MTERGQIWKCDICGNIIEVLHEGADNLVCCGQAMGLKIENTVEASKEKHVPIIEESMVKVGSGPHPMTEEHYIEWIEASGESGEVDKVFLNPGDKPEANFCFKVVSARAYCNLHGLWKSA